MKRLGILLAASSLIFGCTLRGFKAPPFAEEEYTNKAGAGVSQARLALAECGANQNGPVHVDKGESVDNARARVEECMFKKGYYFKGGWGGMCAVSPYRTELPVCANVPLRPRYDYYGQ